MNKFNIRAIGEHDKCLETDIFEIGFFDELGFYIAKKDNPFAYLNKDGSIHDNCSQCWHKSIKSIRKALGNYYKING